MFRADKKKVPLAFVPNGTGNDTCFSIGVNSIDQALEYIQKGDTVKVDLNRCFTDAETFEEVDKIEFEDPKQKFQRCRFSIINASVGFIAKCVHAAVDYKAWAGASAYTLAALKLFFGGDQPDTYRFSLYNKVEGKD